MKHYCGIDWASDHHDISIVNESGKEVNKFRIDDDLNGHHTLSNTLKSFEVEIPIPPCGRRQFSIGYAKSK